jgi:hypothetical protein
MKVIVFLTFVTPRAVLRPYLERDAVRIKRVKLLAATAEAGQFRDQTSSGREE